MNTFIACGSSLALGGLLLAAPVQAQIVPDATLPQNSLVTPGCGSCVINGGTVRGTNLFHSFREFSIPTRGTARFNNAVSIQNILTRVTGNSASTIDGLIQANGTANVFILNPNGIRFGANARLDIGGSFVATTANRYQFPDSSEFSATNPQAPPLLTVAPSALLFNQIHPAPIENASVAFAGFGFGNPVFGLRVPNGRSLLLVGGDIRMEGGRLNAFGGRVELGGLAEPGTVGLNTSGNTLSLIFPNNAARANVALTNRAAVITTGNGGGSITIQAHTIDITGRSGLTTGIVEGLGSPTTQAGDIVLDATGAIRLNNSVIGNGLREFAEGRSGDVVIRGQSLTLENGASIGAAVGFESIGSAGNLRIQVSDAVVLDDAALLTNLDTFAVGRGGDIDIQARSLTLTNDGRISTSIFGNGNAGAVHIRTTDAVTLNGGAITSRINPGAQGRGGDIHLTSGAITLTQEAAIATDLDFNSRGAGGNITIQANSVALADKSALLSATAGQGNAGNITVVATDGVTLDDGKFFALADLDAEGNAGNIEVRSRFLQLDNISFLSSTTFGRGDSGNVVVQTTEDVRLNNTSALITGVDGGAIGRGGSIAVQGRSLTLTDGSQLFANTFGQGRAGDITVNISDAIRLQGVGASGFSSGFLSNTEAGAIGSGGSISVRAGSLQITDSAVISALSRSDFAGGDIAVNVNTLEVTNGGQVLTSTFGQGNAGSITVNATENITLAGQDARFAERLQQFGQVDTQGAASGLFANTSGGVGGAIAVNTDQFQVANGAAMDATTSSANSGGSITVNAREVEARSGGQLRTTTSSSGRAGDITVNGEERVSLSDPGTGLFANTSGGQGGAIAVNASRFQISNQATLNATTSGANSGGSITVNTETFDATSGGQLVTTTSGRGNAGDIFVRSSGNFTLVDAGTGLFASTDPGSTGTGSNIFVSSGREILIHDRAGIAAGSQGSGQGGSVEVSGRQLTLDRQAFITAETASAQGGNITIQTSDLLFLRRNSLISATAGTAETGGDGGNIRITAPFVIGVLTENSDIRANAFTGRGGNVTITAQGIYGLQFQRQPTPFSDITASSQFGISGDVTLNVLNVDPNRGLVALPDRLVDPSSQISQACVPRGSQRASSFVVTGRGGVPLSPDDPLQSRSSLPGWVTLDSNSSGSHAAQPPATPTVLTNQPNPIVEAQGWIVAADGNVQLVATAPTPTSHPSWQPPVNCSEP